MHTLTVTGVHAVLLGTGAEGLVSRDAATAHRSVHPLGPVDSMLGVHLQLAIVGGAHSTGCVVNLGLAVSFQGLVAVTVHLAALTIVLHIKSYSLSQASARCLSAA